MSTVRSPDPAWRFAALARHVLLTCVVAATLPACSAEALCAASGIPCEAAPSEDEPDETSPTTPPEDDTGPTEPTDDGEPRLVVSEAALDFGDVVVGESVTRSIRLENEGDARMEVELRPPSAPFILDADALSFELLPGKAEGISVTFSPTDEGDSADELVVLTTDREAQRTEIALTGSATEPDISVAAGGDGHSINDFVSIVGLYEDSREVTIYNNGSASLEVTDVYLYNDGTGGDFVLSGPALPVSIPVGGRTVVTITLRGAQTAVELPDTTRDLNVCHILSNDPDTPDWTIDLYGLVI